MIRRHAALLVLGALALAGCIPPAGPGPTTTTTTTTTSTTTTTTTTTTVPAESAITWSDPASPATSTTPRLGGTAPADANVVRVFPSSDCTGTPFGGTLAQFTGTGIAVVVGMGTTTAFTVGASGGSATGACSAPFTYVNTLVAPNEHEHEPNGTLAEANVVLANVGQPAEIAGVLDGPVGADIYAVDNFAFTVGAGRSLRISTFDATGLTCALTDTHIYLYPPAGEPGGNDDDGGVDLCSLIDPAVDTYAADVAGGTYRVLVRGIPLGGAYRLRIEVLD